MSYKWGLNGNDIEWDSVLYSLGASEVCVTCEAHKKETGEYPEDGCEYGHVARYSARGWSLEHDSNSNFVETTGNVPLAVYHTLYLMEWLEALEEDKEQGSASQRYRIRKEIQSRSDYEYYKAS